MLNIRDTVLTVVDVQGKLARIVDRPEQTLQRIARLVHAADILDLAVAWTEQAPQKMGPTEESLRALLEPRRPLAKTAFSCCGDAAFVRFLQETGRRQVLLAGIEAHVCIYQTAADLLERGFEVHVAADAVSSRNPEDKTVALDRMRSEGAVVTSTEMSLLELVRDASHPAFRDVHRLIR
jgi:nicotinamidase-related amidase